MWGPRAGKEGAPPSPGATFRIWAPLTAATLALLVAPALPTAQATHDGGEFLKLHGPARLDLDDGGSPLQGVRDGSPDLGPDPGDPGLHGVARPEPALVEAGVTPGPEGAAQHLVVALSVEYHPTFWLPADEATAAGTTEALFDRVDPGLLDYDPITDEDLDEDLDDDHGEDLIDLLGDEDNVPDFSTHPRNRSAADEYFPALLARYTWSARDADHRPTPLREGDRFPLPTLGLGDQVGLDAEPAGDVSTRPRLVDVRDGNATAIRLATDEVRTAPAEAVRFLDLDAVLDDVQEGNPATATFRVRRLGPPDHPRLVDEVRLEAGQGLHAGVGNASAVPGTCDPDGSGLAEAEAPWFLCLRDLDAANGTADVTVGRLLAEPSEPPWHMAANLLVDGAHYHVDDLAVDDTGDGPRLDRLALANPLPLRDPAHLPPSNVSLEGVLSGEDVPLLPPFSRDHTGLRSYDLPPSTTSHGFPRQADGGDTSGIQRNDLLLEDGHRSLPDRTTPRDPLQLRWIHVETEERLVTRHQTPAPSGWTTETNALHPLRYVAVDPPEQGRTLVRTPLLDHPPGDGAFLWDDDRNNSVHLSHGLRLHSGTLGGTPGDRLHVNPAVTRDVAATGGLGADQLTSLAISYEAHALLDDVTHDPNGSTPDGALDLAVLSDEERPAWSGSDDDETPHTVDADGDNLFDIEPANEDPSEGDVHAPAIRLNYTFRWAERGTLALRDAPLTGTPDLAAPADGTRLQLPLSPRPLTGTGLGSCNVTGTSGCDTTLVRSWDDAAATDASVTTGTTDATGLLRLETGNLTLAADEQAAFLDVGVTVASPDDQPDGPNRSRLRLDHVGPGPGERSAVGNGTNVSAGDVVAFAYDYADATVEAAPADGTLDPDGDDRLDADAYAWVLSVNGSVTLRLGRLLPHEEPIHVDGRVYRLSHVVAGTDGDPHGETAGSATPGRAERIHSLSLRTTVPVADGNVSLVHPDTQLTATPEGETLPLLAPFDRDHEVLDLVDVELEENRYGAFDSTVDDDGDATQQALVNRTWDVSPLAITAEATGTLEDRTFAWVDPLTGSHRVSGLFAGDSPATLAEDPGDGSHAGYPSLEAEGTPDPGDHDGSRFRTSGPEAFGTGPLPNDVRGLRRYVTLDVAQDQGDLLLSSQRLAHRPADGSGPANALGFRDLAGAEGPSSVEPSDDPRGWMHLDVDDLHGDGSLLTASDHCPHGGWRLCDRPSPPEFAHFVVDEAACRPARPVPGEDVTCNATVQNVGPRVGTKEVVLERIRGNETTPVETREVTVEAGDSTTVALTWSTTVGTPSGEHTLRVASHDGAETDTVLVQAPAESIEVTEVAVLADQPHDEETIPVAVSVENTADRPATRALEVRLDGAPVVERALTLDPGANDTLELALGPLATGTHEVAAGNWAAEVTVRDASPRPRLDTVALDPEQIPAGVESTVAVTATVDVLPDGRTEVDREIRVGGTPVATLQRDLPGEGTHHVTRLVDLTLAAGQHELRVGNATATIQAVDEDGGTGPIQDIPATAAPSAAAILAAARLLARRAPKA